MRCQREVQAGAGRHVKQGEGVTEGNQNCCCKLSNLKTVEAAAAGKMLSHMRRLSRFTLLPFPLPPLYTPAALPVPLLTAQVIDFLIVMRRICKCDF